LHGLRRSIVERGLGGTLRQAADGRAAREATTAAPSAGGPIPRTDGPVILVVDALMPDPTRDSGSVRMLEILMLLRDIGWNVAFAPDSGRATAGERDALRCQGVEVIGIPGAPPLPGWLEDNRNRLAAAMLCRHEVAAMHFGLVRGTAPQARIAFDTVDLHGLREERTAQVSGDRSLLRVARRSWKVERTLASRSDVTFVVSPVEQELLRKEVPGARVELLSNIHEVVGRTSPFTQRRGMLFVGGFGHPPNRDAAHWLVERILPLLHEQVPAMPLHLVGSIGDEERRLLSREHVHVHGQVADLAPLMEACLVAVAPLRAGAGVKGKVNSAMSHGLPVVATTIAAEGMRLLDGHDVLVADTAAQFAAAIARVAHDQLLWESLSTHGMENIQRHFSRAQARRILLSAFGEPPSRN
jgi:glycosyltransferase involved in cell wall biosynthesis